MLPNFIYIGPDKAGSTWLFNTLAHHPQVFVTSAKDLYFFDRYFDKGIDWYARQFAHGDQCPVVAEISHDYLYSIDAARRMQRIVPRAKLAVCLREPVERTFSAYLHLVKSGDFVGSFEEALEDHPNLIERSLYGKHLTNFLQYFPREQFHVAIFDQLRSEPQQFANQLFTDLNLPAISLSQRIQRKALPAGRSRSVWLTRQLRALGNVFRDLGIPGFVGRVKSSSLVQRLLYVPYSSAEKPRPAAETCRRLRNIFDPDLAVLDDVLDANLRLRWGYREHLSAAEIAPHQPLTSV